MNDPSAGSPASENRDVLFQSAYGGIPKFVLFGMIPFLMIGAALLFVNADLFQGRFALKGIQLTPERVRFVLCPATWLLCVFIMSRRIQSREGS